MYVLKSIFLPISLMILLGSVTGCTGEIYTEVPSSVYGAPKTADAYNKYNGVFYYLPAYVKEVWETTTYVGPDGKTILASSNDPNKKCQPMVHESIIVGADYTKPARLFYSPGLMETNTFKVEFNENGTLKSVNSESTPDKGETLKNVAAAITGLAPIFSSSSAAVPAPNKPSAFVPPEETPGPTVLACNAGKRVTGYSPLQTL